MAIAAVLFDLDGTLVDTEGQIARAVAETLLTFGYEVTREQLHALAGRTLRDWFTGELGMTTVLAEDVYRFYVHHTLTTYASCAQPMPAAERLLRALHGSSMSLAIVTTRVEESARAILHTVGWNALFPLVVAQETAPRPKPAPDPALYALEYLGIAPSAAILVGNTEADMVCGVEAGLAAVVGVVGERTADALFAAGATHVCASLDEVHALLAVGSQLTAEER